MKILDQYEAELIADWLQQQPVRRQRNLMSVGEIREQCTEFLTLLRETLRRSNHPDPQSAEWQGIRTLLESISRTWSQQGCTSAETIAFVFSLKKPLLARLHQELESNPETLLAETWAIDELLDQFGLWAAEVHQKVREAVISRQQEELLELSTPVVKLWDGVLALPVIGTLDSTRTQSVMESLLQTIVETGSQVAIIDITGVPTVDTLTAQNLLKTVAAARLMGAECILSGIRPQIAQTIVYLGIDLTDVVTKATLADAFELALQRLGLKVSSAQIKS
ncbi:STAS domain-containing protein [Leptolyngbya sp. FACHB-261]|uniref:STAS domain-containing protein n=1 Tax=Leptolyngbya sp. FACHB-261 TaxID=2692806 RepID=UPI0018F04CEC|nr:STAS domain-containing protein [Leptolyngbya sp. FACHB-261]